MVAMRLLPVAAPLRGAEATGSPLHVRVRVRVLVLVRVLVCVHPT